MSGSKGADAPIVAYKYSLGVHAGVCHGPVDSVNQIICAERAASMNEVLSIVGCNLTLGQATISWDHTVGSAFNMVAYSEQFDNAYWTKTRASITPNAIASPDGAITADALIEDTSIGASHHVLHQITPVVGKRYKQIVRAKAKSGSRGLFFSTGTAAFGVAQSAHFNLDTGAIISSGGGAVAEIVSLGNGWYKCSMTTIPAVSTSNFNAIHYLTNLITTSYTGDGVSGIYLWGAQLVDADGSDEYVRTEAAPTSKMPTEGSRISGAGIPADSYVRYVTYTGGVLHDKYGNNALATDDIVGGTAEAHCTISKVTSSQTIFIDSPDLFGGDTREGGLVGEVDVMFGESSQPRNEYLQVFQGATCPAYRGFLSLVFKSFQWTSGNPYIKPLWVKVTRILSGWDGASPWYPEKAVVNTYDMNAAHILYECLTNSKWGMGYSPSDMDDANWRANADTLYSEGFGLSLAWLQQSSVNEFVQMVLNHINGALRLDMTSGKFTLFLIRDDYVVGDLLRLDETNCELTSFQRSGYGDLVNELTVEYTDRSENTKPITVQNLASIQAQGGVVTTTRPYPGIRVASLAAKVALRDLALVSTPLAKVSLVANRDMWDKSEGDVVALYWTDHGLNGVPFRIVGIDKGTLTDGKITVDMVEDVFGLPTSAYTDAPDSQWAGEVAPPVPVEAARAIEVPFWEIERGMKRSDVAQLIPEFGFAHVLAVRGAANFPFQYQTVVSSNNVVYTDNTVGHFCPTGELSVAVDRVTSVFTLQNAYDLDLIEFDVPSNGYAYIDDECVAVVSVNSASGEVVVRRGVLDTVPAEHAINARMFFVTRAVAYDQTERVSGELVYYKPLPSTGIGTLPVSDATAISLTLNNRASRPYPPANFKINGSYFPTTVAGPLSVSWSHRDRTQQSVSLIDFTQGSIGPEPNTVARLRLYDGNVLLREKVGGSGFNYSSAEEIADGLVTPLRLVLDSVTYDPWNLLYANYADEFFNVSTQTTAPVDVVLKPDFSKMFVIGSGGGLHQYTFAIPQDVSSASWDYTLMVDTSEPTPTALAVSKDDTSLFVVGSTNKTVIPFTMNTPWDLTSVVNVGELVGIGFSPDGKKMFALSTMSSSLLQYRLSSPWDASTASFVVASPKLLSTATAVLGGAISPNGANVYIVAANDRVYQYTLTTPFDVSTLVYANKQKNVTAQTTTARDVALNSTGTVMRVVGAAASPIYEYTLSTPWDVSTATYSSTNTSLTAISGYPVGGESLGEGGVSVAAQDSSPVGIEFSADGYTMYIVGAATSKIYQYSLTHPWRVSTAVYSGLSLSITFGVPCSIGFNTDGTLMFITCTDGRCYAFTPVSPWNVNGAAYAGDYADFRNEETSVTGVSFDASGLNIVVIGSTKKALQYAMFKAGTVESLYKHDWTVTRTF